MAGMGSHFGAGFGMNAGLDADVHVNAGVGAGYGYPSYGGGYYTMTGTILVLFILLVIISRSFRV